MKRLLRMVFVALLSFGTSASPALAGTIEGTVTPIKWAQEVEVCVLNGELSERCAVPNADGSYVYPGVLEGIVEFIPTYRSQLLIQYYDHAQELAKATSVSVGPGEVRKGINADLLEGGSIVGVVTATAGGALLPEVEVCAASFSSSQPTWKSCDETDAGGEYFLHSLRSGKYKVGFWGQAGSAEYEPTYYQEQSSLSDATPIDVTAGQTRSGIDADLVRGAQISGQVLAAAGAAPLSHVAVCLFSGTEAAPQRCTASAEDGAYTFRGLASGPYQVGFSLEASEAGGGVAVAGADAFESEYYPDVQTRSQAATISLLAPGEAEGIDAHLSGLSPAAPPAVAPITTSPVSTSIALVPEPAPKAARCQKPRHWVKIAGNTRCVRPTNHRKPKKPGKKAKLRRAAGGTFQSDQDA